MAFIIPTSYQPKVPRYQPHRFTNNELKAFFNAVDACKIEKSFPVRHLVYPVLETSQEFMTSGTSIVLHESIHGFVKERKFNHFFYILVLIMKI